MSKILYFNNVYIKTSALVGGPKEAKGPLSQYFDEVFSNLHMGQSSFEAAELFMQKTVISKLLYKSGLTKEEISVAYGGDLINQSVITNYAFREYEIPLVGLYGACSTSILGLLAGAIYLNNKEQENVLTIVSSHNSTSERQFRNPTEYGGAKVETLTSTVTGCAGFILSNEKNEIRISSGLIGKVVDLEQKNMFDMGRAMAPAASESLLEYFDKTKSTPQDYDLILTGDLSFFGKEIIKNILDEKFNFSKNYNDCGLMIYDRSKQEVFAGGSGCSCVGIVSAGYVLNEMKNKRLKKVLIAGTGALMNTMMILQHETIPAISHVICLEVVE